MEALWEQVTDWVDMARDALLSQAVQRRPFAESSSTSRNSSRWRAYIRIFAIMFFPALFLYVLFFRASSPPEMPSLPGKEVSDRLCPQEASLYPTSAQSGEVYRRLADLYGSAEFRSRLADWVSSFDEDLLAKARKAKDINSQFVLSSAVRSESSMVLSARAASVI